ncbi:MAG: helix-turn-helix domain-containing protein [Desulfurococcaceae archaeon]
MISGLNSLYDYNIGIFNVRIRTTKSSFLGKISELSGSKILVNVYPVPKESLYVIIALTYGVNVDKIVKQLLMNDYYLRRSKIISVKSRKVDDIYVIYGLKRECEFYRLAQACNVHIISPYIFTKGSRDYLVVGKTDYLSDYIERVAEYYGRENVDVVNLNIPEKVVAGIMKNSVMNIVLDKLTPAERRIVKNAYERGYFEYPKVAGQDEIGSYLGLSKVTVSIHLRKAFRKVIKDLVYLID